MNIGEYIKLERTTRQWSLRDLSERCGGLSIGFISDVENGRSDPSLRSLTAIAKAFDMGAGDLLVLAGYTTNGKHAAAQPEHTVKLVIRGQIVRIEND